MKVQKKGSAIVLAMLAVFILFIAGVSLLRMGLNSRIWAIRDADRIKAKCAADAGLAKAIYEMNQQLLAKPWNDSTLPSAADVQLENTNFTFNYTVTGDTTNGYSIEATGNCGQAQKTVRTTLRLTGPFEYALFTDGSLSMKNGGLVDWYNYGPGDGHLKVGTNSTQDNKVSLRNGATINGDVLVGPGANPEKVIDNKGTINGQEGNLQSHNDLLPVTVPADIQAKSTSGTMSGNTTLPAGRYKYTAVSLGNSKVLTVSGNVVMYVAGDVSFGNSAGVQIDNGASLTIYVGGNFDGKNGAGFNNGNSTKQPKQLQIFGLDTCTSMDFKNNSELYGTIYAPKASVLFNNGVPTYGSVVAETFEQKNSANFYYDASLKNVGFNDDLIHFVTNRWNED